MLLLFVMLCASGAQDADVLARHAHDLSSDTRLLATLRHRLANHDVETQRWRLDAALWQRECFRLSQEAARASVRPSSAPQHDRTGPVGSATSASATTSFEKLFDSLARSTSDAHSREPPTLESDVIDVDSDDALGGHRSESSVQHVHEDDYDQIGVGESMQAVRRDHSASNRGSPTLLKGTVTTTLAPFRSSPNFQLPSPVSVFASPVAPPVFRSGDISAAGLSALHVTADQLHLSRSIASLKRAMEATPTPVSPPATTLTTTDDEPTLGSPHSIAAEFRDYFERRYGGEGKKESRADLVMSAASAVGVAGASVKAAYSAATAQAQQAAAAAVESKVGKITGRPKTASRHTVRDSLSSRVVPWTDLQEMAPPPSQQLPKERPQQQLREAEEMAADALLREQWARDKNVAQEPLTLSGLRTPTANTNTVEPWRAKLGRLTTHHDVSLVSSLAASPSTSHDQ